ncbi:hypothetical protein GYMLUDRAFT_241410 [Collybiopsis luxurians FD-317 M1]|uniref:Uncharacterized protein n=1 Tax=Collybiopsis luxurians FD-317 M1 TaxID=944289 RepID=A0A0D0BJ65_9AGAR|nr:hypothetical protein GYMLUDRAFT_241410 [Collybiopsis luxurians FD-317 M1]
MSLASIFLLPRLIMVIVECILYGIYIVLFGLAVWILPRKFDTPSVKRFFFPAIVILFFFATISLAFDLMAEVYVTLFIIPPSWVIKTGT